MMIRTVLLLWVLILPVKWVLAQSDEDAFMIKDIHSAALKHGDAYEWLRVLTKDIGPRLAGSPQAAAAVDFALQMFDTLGFDSVWLQACEVPHWVRGDKEVVRVVYSPSVGQFDIPALALGNSEGTGRQGLTAEVIECYGLENWESLTEEDVRGKIVFFSKPMDDGNPNTFHAYGEAVGQRVFGASMAAKKGAVGVMVRSMTTLVDDIPHTGVMIYREETPTRIPAVAISTRAAEMLSGMLRRGERVEVYMQTTCRNLPPKTGYNVIGERRGSTYPDEIILVGGHLDSWDIGEGAHDDGAGCVQSLEVINLFNKLGYTPQRTLRVVWFANEENGMAGAIKYKEESDKNGEYHMAAIESDRGGFAPRGFTCEGDESVFVDKFRKVSTWSGLFQPYGLSFQRGGSGADIYRLANQKGLLCGLLPDTQRYFDYHHAKTDTFEAVNKRELQLGAAAMASFVYMLDQYGLD